MCSDDRDRSRWLQAIVGASIAMLLVHIAFREALSPMLNHSSLGIAKGPLGFFFWYTWPMWRVIAGAAEAFTAGLVAALIVRGNGVSVSYLAGIPLSITWGIMAGLFITLQAGDLSALHDPIQSTLSITPFHVNAGASVLLALVSWVMVCCGSGIAVGLEDASPDPDSLLGYPDVARRFRLMKAGAFGMSWYHWVWWLPIAWISLAIHLRGAALLLSNSTSLLIPLLLRNSKAFTDALLHHLPVILPGIGWLIASIGGLASVAYAYVLLARLTDVDEGSRAVGVIACGIIIPALAIVFQLHITKVLNDIFVQQIPL
jgi:hypothetical protein